MATKKNNTLKLKFESARSYAPAPESRSAATINERYELFINGKFDKPQGKKYFDSINPATEEKLSSIAEAGAADVDRAVKAARNACSMESNCGAERSEGVPPPKKMVCTLIGFGLSVDTASISLIKAVTYAGIKSSWPA